MELIVVGIAVAAISGWTLLRPNRGLRVSRPRRFGASTGRETNRATYRVNTVISFAVLATIAVVIVLVVQA